MLHGVRAGWPAGDWGIRELCPSQASLPAAFGKDPAVRRFLAPDRRHLQRRHNQVQVQWIWSAFTLFLLLYSGLFLRTF